MADVLVLHTAIAGAQRSSRAAALLARLPYARRLALERRDHRSRHASLAGIALVLAGAGRLRGSAVSPSQLEFPANLAPRLAGGPWFSVSHSPTRVAVALSRDCRLGLDVEDAAAARAATATFAGTLERWTAIEAALKATGTALAEARDVRLAEDLSGAEVRGVVLCLRALDLGAGCTASLATQEPVGDLTVEQLNDPW